MGCEPTQEYTTANSVPHIEYAQWEAESFNRIEQLLQERIEAIEIPKLIVFELGHFKLPVESENMEWAQRNVAFVDRLIGTIVRRHGKEIRLLATLLVNNLEDEDDAVCERVVQELFEDKKYIPPKALKILSERNMKNRAYKALKKNSKLAESFIHIDGKAYLKDEEYQHDLAAGFVDDQGQIIPRCGLILTSYLDRVAQLAHARMYPQKRFEVIFVSFSEQFHEYQRVKLGVDIYSTTHTQITISPVIIHWNYRQNSSLVSWRSSDRKRWNSV